MGEQRASVRNALLAFVAPILLGLVALNQLYLAATTDLTPWRGGGFGMFSTADRPEHRAVRTTLLTREGTIVLDVPALIERPTRDTAHAFIDVQALPDRARADAWVDALTAWEWEVTAGVARRAGPAPDDAQPGAILVRVGDGGWIEVETVVTEIWRPSYERATGRVTPELVARVVIPLNGGAP